MDVRLECDVLCCIRFDRPGGTPGERISGARRHLFGRCISIAVAGVFCAVVDHPVGWFSVTRGELRAQMPQSVSRWGSVDPLMR